MTEEGKPNEDRDSRRPLIEVPTPWGVFRLRGHDILTLSHIFFLCFLLWGFNKVFDYMVKADEERHSEHQAILTQNTEHSFILHLSPEERAALKLPMPESLRKRVGPDEYYNFLAERYKKEIEKNTREGYITAPNSVFDRELNSRGAKK